MSDSGLREELAAKREQNREQRLQAVKRWANHIKETPVEHWGAELNTLVNDQIEAAQQANHSAEHLQRVRAVASDIKSESTDEPPQDET